MTKRHAIMVWATALAALAVVGLLVGCSVVHRPECTIYRFGPEPPATRPADPRIGLPVVGPDRETALPAIQVCSLYIGIESAGGNQ